MRRLMMTLAAGALLVAACGGDASSCEDIADELIAEVQGVIDEVDQMSLDEVASAGEGDVDFLAEFDERAERLADQATEAGCSDQEMTELITDRASSLTAESEFGQVFVDLIGSGGFEGL